MESSTQMPNITSNVNNCDLSSRTNSQASLKVEIQNLRRVVDDIPMRLWIVAIIGFWERFTFWGLTAPWQNYMENARGKVNGAPGALGLGQAMATRIYCAFYLIYYTTPLLFAIISDTRLGRFNTLCISVVLYALGCGVIMVSSIDSCLDLGLGIPGLAAGMVFVGLGGGGFKIIMVPFIADQYTERQPRLKVLKSGEIVVTDRSLTLQYIYNMYYWVGNVGSLSWFATTFLEQYYSFTLAYATTFGSIIITILITIFGSRWYVKLPCEGNVLPMATSMLLCASKNGFRMSRAYPEYILEHHGKRVHWTSQLVDEVCRGLRACRVLIAFIVFYVCFDQMQNNLISQANQMQTNNIPNDMMPAMNQVACIVLGPIIQYALYPFLRRCKISSHPIARITAGFGAIALAMLYATIIQHMIYSAAPCYEKPGVCHEAGIGQHEQGSISPNKINVWIQTPVYVFIAFGEIFACVTALEYAYDHSPTNMKAIIQAINLLTASGGSAVAMGLTPIARDPHLTSLYASLTVAMAVTTLIFWILFRKYDRLARGEDEHAEDILPTS